MLLSIVRIQCFAELAKITKTHRDPHIVVSGDLVHEEAFREIIRLNLRSQGGVGDVGAGGAGAGDVGAIGAGGAGG